ncbi:MAG: hypothetical protein HQK49_13285 [Oligoflexia bacterium]|nr:hypothetical protein [Oligoflexia bacterium]
MCYNKKIFIDQDREFAQIPNIMITGLDISPSSYKVGTYLISCADIFHPSVNTIIKRINLSQPTVKNGLKELVEKQVIRCDPWPLKRGRKSYITFLPINEWIVTIKKTSIVESNNYQKDFDTTNEESSTVLSKNFEHIKQKKNKTLKDTDSSNRSLDKDLIIKAVFEFPTSIPLPKDFLTTLGKENLDWINSNGGVTRLANLNRGELLKKLNLY